MIKPWLLSLTMISLSVVAQQIPPNDIELRAAYCLAVAQDRLAAAQFIAKADVSEYAADIQAKLKVAADGTVDEAANRLNRLRAYVGPKDHLDHSAMLIAHKRGQIDGGLLAQQRHTCIPKCGNAKTIDAFTACSDSCGEPELKRRIAQCEKLDWLPF